MLIAAFLRTYMMTTLPPGIKYDSASNGVYILSILHDGLRPFFVTPMGAPEPLILYLQSLTVWLFGASAFALKIVTVVASTLTVAFLFAAGQVWTRDARVASIAAFALAVSLEVIYDARAGLRFVLVPLFVSLVLFFLARSWRYQHMIDYALAGFFAGLSVYVYPSALFVPLVVAAIFVHQFFFARAAWRWHNLVLASLVGFVVALPRIVFHLQYPAAALARANQVNLFTNPAVATDGLLKVILNQLWNYALMFGIDWKGGTLSRPLFDFPVLVLFVIGILVCLARLRRIEFFWAPLMLAIMFLPDLLAANEPIVNKVRSIGIVPPAFFVIGVGAVFLIDAAKNRIRFAWLVPALIGVCLFLNLAQTWDAFFVQHIAVSAANLENTDFDNSRIEFAQASWIARQTDPVYVPLNEYARSSMHYLIGARAPLLRSALDTDGSLRASATPARAWIVLPDALSRPRTEGVLYVHDPASYVAIAGDAAYLLPPAQSIAEDVLRARVPDEIIRDWSGVPVARAYRVEDTSRLFQFVPMRRAQEIRFSKGVSLMASSIEYQSIAPPGVIPLTLWWTIAQRTSDDYAIFIHLLDANGEVLTTADISPALGAYPTFLWKPDEIVATHHRIKVPARAVPGKYVIEIGMYNILNQERLDVLDAGDSRVVIGAAKIAPREKPAYNPSQTQRANFDNQIGLIGYDFKDRAITLYFQSLAAMNRDYTLFVHIVDRDGKIVAQSDHQPQERRYPTSIWDVGEQVRDEFSLVLPEDAAPGKYAVRIGWYDGANGERLPVRDANDRIIGDFALLDSMLELTR